MKFKAGLGLGLFVTVLGFVSPAHAEPDPWTSNAISQKLSERIGMDTSNGPGNGVFATAWAVNKIVKEALGFQLGKNPDFVNLIEAALKSGQGEVIRDRFRSIPGDIVVGAGGNLIVGICLNYGCSNVISNSASDAKLSWISTTDFDGIFPGSSTIYRVVDQQN